MNNTTSKRRTKALVYENGNIGINRFNTMKEAIDVVKNLTDPKTIKGIALYSGDEYQETIPIDGLM